MKTEIIENKKNELNFPCLMTSSTYKYIVYFTKWMEGIVLYSESSNYHQPGYFSNNWNMKCFEKFEGKIILENN